MVYQHALCCVCCRHGVCWSAQQAMRPWHGSSSRLHSRWVTCHTHGPHICGHMGRMTWGHTDNMTPCTLSARPWLCYMLSPWLSCISMVLEYIVEYIPTPAQPQGRSWKVLDGPLCVDRHRQEQWQHISNKRSLPTHTHKHNASSSCCIVYDGAKRGGSREDRWRRN